ncbi:ThiF family adenylyltransferase [Olivibacter sp. SDN3]|uniref:ThiF family adenylyltransferase n=1 Tax=Olivibacter sp. SDN3 TaxID=2764720 RepID=UPI0016515DCF|nr:ThiF family adenylyltransferase [Olivibacter sp. SDN3]QNL52056.1 ThiF family adenylyltransferase [Olivibacter sp. SDN3]
MHPEQVNRFDQNNYQVKIFYRRNSAEKKAMDKFLADVQDIQIVDTIYQQLIELVKISYPSYDWNKQKFEEAINELLGNQSCDDYGTWVYYPWLGKIVHLLDEDDFIKVRTSRNIYKITPEEIAVLRNKRIGIIGLSVGQSIAQTMAMERICGELRLADFDNVELSNMNRVRCAVHELGINKTVLAARQIAEQDPYLKVVCYQEGVNIETIDEFLTGNGKLDLLVEECDGIDIKIIARIKARALKIPVIMDTNDMGMLDVERYDHEPDRPIFHGRLPQLDDGDVNELALKLKHLRAEEKVPYLVDIIGMENVSAAMKVSLAEMNKTIVGWPQLASSVVLGGAMVTDVGRRILLGKHTSSGRYFIDFDELIQG